MWQSLATAILSVALVLTTVSGATAQSKWLLLEVSEHGEISLKAATDSHHPPSKCKGHPAEPDNHVVLTYTDPTTGIPCVVRSPDPRRQFHDHEKDDGKWGGGIHYHKKISFAVTVHKDVEEFHTFDYKNTHVTAKRHYITQDHHRAHQTMSTVTIDASQVVMTPLQVVGPLQQQKNIVFLSSGYTSAEKSKFDSDVQTLLTFTQLPDPSSTLSSQPYRRYFSQMNLYKVWYPSAQSGASHPPPAGNGITVDNNFDCAYGVTSARILVCNRDKVLLAGSYAPPSPNDVIYMILVNDVLFGGTGGAGVCTTYTGSQMKVIFIHEIGHAGTALSDEYDYGYVESASAPVTMKNCHWSDQGTPWDRWILAAILPQPTQVCTYTNYWKPTPGNCLMESNQPSYCPVCASNVLEEMYDHGLNLASPRFPSMYETAYVELGKPLTLYINTRVPSAKDETGAFLVTWTVQGYPATATATYAFGVGHLVNGSGFLPSTTGDYIINCTIEDDTNMLLAYDRQTLLNRNGNNATALRQITQFRVTVYATGTTPNCTTKKTIFNDSYCASCDAGHEADCNNSYSPIPLQSVVDVDAKLQGLQSWLLGVGGLFLALGILIFILIWRMMALHAEHHPREILPLSTPIVVLRVTLLVLQIALLLASTAAIVFSVYMYNQLSVFGRTLMLGLVATAVVVWFSSFVGFCAAYYKNRGVLFVNFILLLLLFGCAVLFTTLLLYMLYHITDKSVQQQLQGEWETAVSNDPKSVCTLEQILQCSGFNTSCYTVALNPAGTSNCPSSCEVSNGNGNPCYIAIRDFVQAKFGTASIGGIALCVLLLTIMILALVLGCSIKSRRNYIHKERRRRHQNGESSLSPEEIAMIRREFNKVDKDGSGDITRQEFGQFYNAVMGVTLTPRELEEYFDKLDADGNGVLSFEEFIKVYVPQKEKSRKNLAQTKSMIYGGAGQSIHSATPAEAAMLMAQQEEEAAARANTAHSQAPLTRHKTQEMQLDLALDEDLHVDLSPEEAARAQEERAKEEAARVAKAQAERQRRMQQDRPSNLDVDLVLDDAHRTYASANSTHNANMNLEIDLDNEQFE